MIISHKHKFIFIHIPKTGGTSIKRALEPYLGKEDITGVDSHSDLYYHHRTSLEIKKLVGDKVWNSYFKFAFVRNPWDLMVSEFHYFKNTPYLVNIVPNYKEIVEKEYKTFKGFMISQKNNIFRNYMRYLNDENNNIMIDFIGKFENMDQDFNYICKKIGINNLSLSHLNKSNHEDYSNYYDEDSKRIVEEIFSKEIDIFKYRFEKKALRNNTKIDGLRERLEKLKNKSKTVLIESNKRLPLVSIITSIYNGDKYIKEFLKDITRQSVFDKCELILINANSPGNEETIIRDYIKKYPNIIYRRLQKDPGLYECWNMAINMSKGKYITNANLDDRRAPDHIKLHLEKLEKDPYLDLVCSELYVTDKPNETWENNSANKEIIWFSHIKENFKLKEMFQFQEKIIPYNIPHCMPVWRKDMHYRFGFFDEKKYGSVADYGFWIKCLQKGSRFKLIKKPLGLYLLDKNSHNRKDKNKEIIEKRIIEEIYKPMLKKDSIYPRKINILKAVGRNYGAHHRSGWNYAIYSLGELHSDKGILLDAFIEKKFAWGSDPGDKKNNFKPYDSPWIGFIHCPPNIPVYFKYDGQSYESIFNMDIWKQSIKHCKGIFCLSKYHRYWLERKLNVPIENLIHPTETPDTKFDFNKFLKNDKKKVIQIGFWLRKLNSIYLLKTKIYEKIMLKTRKDNLLLEVMQKERAGLNIKVDEKEVKILDYMSDEEYDNILSENIVFMELYDSSANNVIVECIVRNTPLLINPLPAVVEYLGEDYPFYFNSREEAVKKAEDFDLIKKTHEYLTKMDKEKFTGEYFLKSLAESKIYKDLQYV